MPRLVVVLPLEPLRADESFAVPDWPLHVTLLPPFETDAAPRVIAELIASASATQHPLVVVAERDELFGRRNDVPVTVLEANDELVCLHQWLVDAVRPYATRPDEPAFTGIRFRAHITAKKHARAHPGDAFTLSQIALVDMAPRAAPSGRTVLATVELSASGAPHGR